MDRTLVSAVVSAVRRRWRAVGGHGSNDVLDSSGLETKELQTSDWEMPLPRSSGDAREPLASPSHVVQAPSGRRSGAMRTRSGAPTILLRSVCRKRREEEATKPRRKN